MLVDEIIQKIQAEIEILEKTRKTESDSGRKFLLRALRNILRYAMVNLAVFYCRELQNINSLNYLTKKQNTIVIPVDRSFMDRSARRLLLLDAWGQFEFYFSKKVPKSGRMTTNIIVENYYKSKNQSVPNEITFFRETRNCFHGNGVYNTNKQLLHCSIKNQQYSLTPGQEIKFADYQFLLDIIDTVLGLL